MTFSTTNNSWYIPDMIELVEEDMPDFSDNIPSDLKDFRRKLELIQGIEGTGIIVLAVSKKNDDLNDTRSIPALCGEPINVGVYDMVKDYYYASCYSFLELGAIPVNYKLCIKGVHDWVVDVPVPLPIVERYLTESQQKAFDDWKESLGNIKDFLIETIQAVYVY